MGRTPNIDDGEILDDIITRSRGEIRHTQSSKVTSSTPTSLEGIKPSYSPQIPQKLYSPRISELRRERSSLSPGKGLDFKLSPSPNAEPGPGLGPGPGPSIRN